MEQQRPATIPENQTVKDYQTPLSRRKRFFDNSDKDGFYLETLQGGYRMPNRFCACQDTKSLSSFFFVSRDGERFIAYLVTIYDNGKTFIIQIIQGNIWENYQTLERYCMNAEFLDVDHTLNDLNQQLKNLFTNFQITI